MYTENIQASRNRMLKRPGWPGTLSSVKIVLRLNVLLYFVILVTSICPTGCSICNGNVNRPQCYICNEGYWLQNGNCIACPVNCLTCTNFDKCEVCAEGFWNKTSNCRSKCPDNCLAGCEEQTGNCNMCKAGYYGVTCNYSCEHCLEHSCSTTTCLQCKNGYTRIVLDGYGICQPQCPTNCVSCYNASHCEKCSDGFYSYRTHCIPCSSSTSCHSFPDCHLNDCARKNTLVGAVSGSLVGGFTLGGCCVLIFFWILRKVRRARRSSCPDYRNTQTFNLDIQENLGTEGEIISRSTDTTTYEKLSESKPGNVYSIVSTETRQDAEESSPNSYYNMDSRIEHAKHT